MRGFLVTGFLNLNLLARLSPGGWLSSLLLVALLSISPLHAEPPAAAAISRDFFFDLLPRKDIRKADTGLNAFFNDQRFGTIAQQMKEVRSTLGIRTIRILLAWNDDVQPTPTSPVNFSFYDDIMRSVPRGTRVLVILTGVPSWMSRSANWDREGIHATVVRRWVRPVVRRYRARSSVFGWQLWNEPNDKNNSQNELLGFVDHPEQYVSFLNRAATAVRRLHRTQKIVSAATTAINQNYPETLDYNRGLIASGISSRISVFAFHYYGTQIERVLIPDGVADFLNSVRRPLWMTESGRQGFEGQRDYVLRLWPFLRENIRGIRLMFYYQFTEGTDAQASYGLRNIDRNNGYSDLYYYLKG